MAAIQELPAQLSGRLTEAENGCWIWQGMKDTDGYGRVSIAGRMLRVHRHVYTLLIEPIPGDLTIDHLCFNRPCANPAHLEPVTRSENSRRAAAHFTRDTCPRGHAFADHGISEGGKRRCGICRALGRAALERRRYALRCEAARALGISTSRYEREYGNASSTARAVLSGR